MNHSVITTGISDLDSLLDGFHVGDNVIWYDSAGNLINGFSRHILRAALRDGSPLIYINSEHSPSMLMDILRPFIDLSNLVILDCFTNGKGEGEPLFQAGIAKMPWRVVPVTRPRDPDSVLAAVMSLHAEQAVDENALVRLIFDGITGFGQLWEDENRVVSFYARACPRLYELNTIACWYIEKQAHSAKMRAQINKIAQVVIELSRKGDRRTIHIVKAENRSKSQSDNLDFAFAYREEADYISIDTRKRKINPYDLGMRIRELRTERGFSQTDLARLVGVTPSTISQVEGNLIYPSLPALFKMAETLGVEMGALFQAGKRTRQSPVFSFEANDSERGKNDVVVRRCMVTGSPTSVELFFVSIPGKKRIPTHFFTQKGEEFGCLIRGRLEMKTGSETHEIQQGNVIHLTREIPTQWRNNEEEAALLLWGRIP